MNQDEHRKIHIGLHKALDQLFADYIQHHPTQHNFLETPLKDFIEWSHRQTIQPDEVPLATLQAEASK